MPKARLVIDTPHAGEHLYKLMWYFPEEADIGGGLTKVTPDELKTRMANAKKYIGTDKEELALSDLEHVAASLAAMQVEGYEVLHSELGWESKSAATKALRLAKAAIKAALSEAREGREWPEWAVQAAAAGWKAPKGWKP